MGGALTQMVGRAPAAGGGSGPTSTQWRLRFPAGTSTANANASAVNIAEVEMRATAGGTDQCTGGTASASTEYSGSFTANKAFGGTSGLWASTDAGSVGSWLQYTFASAVAVNEIVVTAPSGAGPTAIQLQYHDGSQWVTYIEVAGPLSWATGTQTFTYAAPYAEAGYTQWRLYFITGSSGSFLQLWEVELRAAVSGVDRCFGGVASSSSFYDGNRTPNKAFDNTSTGFPFVTSGNGTSGWLQWTFWRKEQIAEIQIAAFDSSSGPQQFRLEYYDGATWQTAYTSASGLSWSTTTRTFTV